MTSKFIIYCKIVFSYNIKKKSILKYGILYIMIELILIIYNIIIYYNK